MGLCRKFGRLRPRSSMDQPEAWNVQRDGSSSTLQGMGSCVRRSRWRGRRRISGAEVKDRERTEARDCRGRASPLRIHGRREAGAQVAALADELGLDPPARSMEPKIFNAPRSPQLGSGDGDATPRGEVPGPSGQKKGVESQMTKVMFPSATNWVPPAASTPPVPTQDPAIMTALQEKLKEARARLGRKRRSRKWLLQVLAERVLDSTADALVTAELDSRRRRYRTGSPDQEKPKRARTRKQEERKIFFKRGETVESYSSDEGLGREDESKVRRTAAYEARSATPLRPDDDATPFGASGRGLRSSGRGAIERSGSGLSRDSSQTASWSQAQFRGVARVAVACGSRGLADARPTGECRRRSDSEIPRSRGGVSGKRAVSQSHVI